MAESPSISTAALEAETIPHSALRTPHFPELLAPAGDWECARAAVENGADAIYFGLEKFNARMRARNFTGTDLPRLMEFLHRRGVKGYVTFNTLVFANELAEATQYLRAIIAAGVDAAIVQDVGICRLIRRLSPDFPIHASTQMTITSAAGVEFARELGCHLVVLARENSLKEIEKIQEAQRASFGVQPSGCSSAPGQPEGWTPNLPLEVFVHGALCVAYSGQCLTSEALGGRSANRGECAQACRMPYELISDGNRIPLGDKKYLLSPQDLAGLEVLSELVRLGVASLKIEGRLKSPEYVAGITRVYRQALDDLRFTIYDLRESRSSEAVAETSPARKSQIVNRQYEMEMSFSRGLSTGWFRGNDHQALVHARFGKKRGVSLGEVTRVLHDAVVVRLAGPLKPGDGIVFDAGHPEEKEAGGRVFKVQSAKRNVQGSPQATVTFGRGAVDFTRVHVGDKVWKTSDPELDRRLRRTFAGDVPRFQRPIHLEVHGHAGAPLTLIAGDEPGHIVQIASTVPLAPAEKQPLTTERLTGQLGRLGGTPFTLGDLHNHLEGDVILPVRELNALRRAAVAQLEALRAQPKRWTLNECGMRNAECGIEHNGSHESKIPRPALRAPQLIVLVRSLAQLESALRCGVETVYCEFADPKKYREAVTLFHTARGCAVSQDPKSQTPSPSIWVAPPRITKPGEEWILQQVRSCNADGYLVRNYDHLKFFAGCRRIGDFSLNVANPLTAEYFKEKFGLERVTASYDLNITQLEALLRAAPPEWFEVTIHQHMPMFHMEHCVFCAFLSTGKDYRDCGRPCDKHDVKLRDRVGMEHPLKADVGCRNTVFNARAQTGAEFIEPLLAIGARHFRIEFVNESPVEVARTITQYRALLRGEITGARLWQELKLINQLGVTRGQLDQTEVRKVVPKA